MPQVTLPNALVDGVEVAYGSSVYANDAAITSVVNGQIANDNIASNAAIDGKKISTNPGERIPTTAIEDSAVTSAKIRSEADDANDSGRSIASDHIKNGVVERKKLSTVAGKKITFSQLEATFVTTSLITLSGSAQFDPTTTISGAALNFPIVARPVVNGAVYNIQIDTARTVLVTGKATFYGMTMSLNPASYGTGTLNVATTLILSVYPSDVTYVGNGTATLKLNITYITLA